MKMLDSINCEPYGYIKYEHDDTNHSIIEEVEDVKHNNDTLDFIDEVEDVKQTYLKPKHKSKPLQNYDTIELIEEVEVLNIHI
jgi:hypothetical protein